MRASTVTLLSLFEYFKIMGVSPWEAAQIGEGFPNPATNQCQSVWFQYPWQMDFVSREEVAQAIAEAEYAIAEQLGFWPAPQYIVDEHVAYPRAAPLRQQGLLNVRGEWKAVNLRWRHIVGGGLFNRTLIGATANLTLSDADGDGVNELFTCSIATAITDPLEIGVYVQSADRNAVPIDESWRIRPVNVAISGGVATITGHSSLLVKPDLTLVTNPVSLDVTDATIYVSQVDVYRVFRDDTATDANPYQGVAVWDSDPSCEPDCTFEISPVCIGERLSEQGLAYVSIGQWPCRWIPNRLQLNYAAGYPLDSQGRMNGELARCVAYLATALLTGDKCGCDRSARILHYWRAKPNEGDAGRNYTLRELDENPYPDRVGGIWVWKRIQSWRSWGAVSV